MSTNEAILDGRRAYLWAEVMLLLVALVWGASYGLAKTAVLFYPVLGFLAVRFCITSALLQPAWRGLTRHRRVAVLKAGVPLGLILLSIFVSETYGLSLTRASNAAFLISMCVVFTPFVEWIVLGFRPSIAGFVAAGVSLVGAWLLTSGATLSLNGGDALILAAAVLRAMMVTFTNKLTRGRDIPAFPLTGVQTGVVGLGCVILGIAVLPGGLPELPHAPLFWSSTGFLVVFCTLFAFFAQNYALRRTSPTRVSLLMGMEPVFGALFAVYWLHETLSARAWLGGVLIMSASVWAALRRSSSMPEIKRMVQKNKRTVPSSLTDTGLGDR
ncbi:DMT family transporter [Dyella psychrodurans]|nr:EamA family transporter [Dyella psychrodurans]